MPSEFQFRPQNGELGAFQKVDVRVVFTPLTCRRVRSVLECDVLGNPPRLKILFTKEDCIEILDSFELLLSQCLIIYIQFLVVFCVILILFQ
jgi:hypothetical protein